MAKNCTDIKDARRRIKKIMNDASSASPIEAAGILLRGFHDLANDASAKLYPEIIDLIKVQADRAGVLPLIGDPSTVFSDKVDINRAVAAAEERIRNLSKYEETISRKGQVKREVLKGLFGENGAAQLYFLRSSKNGFGAYNERTTSGTPGFIDIFFTSRNKGKLVTQGEVAENVLDAKQEYLDKVIDFLTEKGTLTEDLSDGLDILFLDGEYTGALEPDTPLYKAIQRVFDPKIMTSNGHLDSLYREYKKGNKEAKKELEAYNAWVLLNNFDTMLTLQLDDTVAITDPSLFNKIGNTGYKTNVEKATNMWNFGFGDDVTNVGDLVSNITQLLIESSRRYTWRGLAIDDAYIGFTDFNYVIGKIKSFAVNPKYSRISLSTNLTNENTGESYNPLENISETTKLVLAEIERINIENGEADPTPTLGLLVAFMSENPMRHLHAIFDILCNTTFIDDGTIQFEEAQTKNLIWSLYKEVFGQEGNNSRSLFDLHHNTTGDTIFPIITQIADSMFAEDIILYYEDENGVLYSQLLKDYAVQQFRNDLAAKIQALNGYFTDKGTNIADLDPEDAQFAKKLKTAKSFTELYNVKTTYSDSIEVRFPRYQYDADKKFHIKTLAKLRVPIVLDGAVVGGIDIDPGKASLDLRPDLYLKVWKSAEFRKLIFDALGIDFENDVDFLAAYESTFPGAKGTGINYAGLMSDITRVIGPAIFNLVFNNEYVPKTLLMLGMPRKLSTIRTLIRALFDGKDGVAALPRLNPETGLISVIPDISKNEILGRLGEARAIASNVFASALVKTGEGTSLSSFCLSRLRNSYPYQLVTLNRARWSASNFMTFVRNENGLFRGVDTGREIKSKATVKTSTKMSGVETWSLNFYNDWVAAFCDKHREKSPVGKGGACFIPSVNSDKGLQDRLLCDLTAESHIPSGRVNPRTGKSIGKSYIELTDEELITELKTEFGPFYRNVINNIINETGRVLKVLGVNYAPKSDNIVSTWQELLDAISDYFINREIARTIKDPLILKHIQTHPGLDFEIDPIMRGYLVEQFVKESGKTEEELKKIYGSEAEIAVEAYSRLRKKYAGSISEGLHEVLTAYNKNHSRNPIQLATQIHYLEGKSGLTINKVLAAQWGRFDATADLRIFAGITGMYYPADLWSKLDKFSTDNNVLLSTYVIEELTPEDIATIKAINPALAEEVKKALYNLAQSSAEGYFYARDLEAAVKLLKGGCKIYLSGPKAKVLEETEFLRNLDGGQWVTRSGMMAFTRVEDPVTHRMIPTNSIYAINEARKNDLKIEIHPMISKLNKMDYLTTQQYMCCVGGAHYVYKGRSGANVLEEEANRWLASNKRNVCYTATVHKFQNKVLNGAPTVYNYAIIEDIEAALYNINGELKKHTPIDGGMIVNGFMPELENNSLGGEAAGTDKKHFATFYFELYGAGGITKTAGFAVTNERMRNSPLGWRILQENMCNRKWIKEFSGEDADIPEELDITKDYDGNDINWLDKKVFYYREQEDGTIKFYRLAKIEKTANPNEYNIYEIEIDQYGNDLQTEPVLRETEIIDNNWVLFNDVFGGYKSLGREVDAHGEENPNSPLVPSEYSRKLMVEAINRVGYRKTRENSYTALNKYGEVFTAYDQDSTKEEGHEDDQDDVWQPLKYSDVHFTPNIGAIKSTQMNVNPAEAMSERMDLNIMRIKMAQLGIQLDKEHHADEAELSMPTQIITACANRGFTLTKTSELYQALSNLTEMAIEDCMDGIMDLLPEGEHKGILQAKIAEIIVDKLIYSLDDNEALHAVMQHLEEKRKAGNNLTPEDVKGQIPWSDTVTYNKIYSDLASHLTSQAIKLKISGSLAVICPTHHLEQLHGNKRITSLIELIPGGLGELAALEAYQEQVRTNGSESELIFDAKRDAGKSREALMNLASKIDTQHIYNLEYVNPLTGETVTKTITVNYPLQYWQIKDEIAKKGGRFNHVTLAEMRGAIASALADGSINIVDASEVSPEFFYAYIKGDVPPGSPEGTKPSITSLQKLMVFEKLNEEGYTLDELYKLLGNDPSKIRLFLLFHEMSHVSNNDSKSYPKKIMVHPVTGELRSVLDYFHDDAIAIETRATRDAWDRMREIVNGGPNALLYLEDAMELTSVHENVIKGRELSAYNVRFRSFALEENGEEIPEREFCMYDLDSLRLLYEVVNDVMPKKGPGINDIKQFGKNRLATLDGIYEFIDENPLLSALSSSVRRIYGSYMATNHKEVWEQYKKLDEAYKKAQALASHYPKNKGLAAKRSIAYTTRKNFLHSTPEIIEAYKYAIKTVLKLLVLKDLFALSSDYKGPRTIMSQGKIYQIDGKSLKNIAYELIMPKIYKTIFGLRENDDLQTILEDKDFFAKRAMSKLKKTIADDSLYDYQLKRFSGDHLYILDARKGIPPQLKSNPRFHLFKEQDGTYSRVNMQGEVIYPLSSESDTVMMTEDGTEVIVTTDPKFFIEHNIFNTATFSNSRVGEEDLQTLIDELKDSTSKMGGKFKRLFSNKKGELKKFGSLKKRNQAFATLQDDATPDTSSPELNSIIAEIYQEGRKVHASFNRSLDVIAGRVPAQSLQSFMTQRVVAFGDADINAAYVSTFQLFILGSDLDIDTVNLIGAGFDNNGHYVMWSPYANIESEELIQASEKLPFPTGKTTPVTYDNTKDSFFVTYDKYFGRDKLFDFERDSDTGEILVNEAGVPVIGINTEAPYIIEDLGAFLREVEKNGINLKGTYGEDNRWHYSRELDSEIYEEGLKFKDYAVFTELGLKPTLLHDLALQIKKIIDDHNLYIKRVDRSTKELMAKNLAHYQMYSVIAEPSNLTEAQESIDGPTKAIKGDGGAVEVAMSDEDKYDITSNNEKLSGPDPVTKADSYTTGQIGKADVGIGAKGVQGNSIIQFAWDSILNSDAPDEVKERILLPIAYDENHKIRTHKVVINGKLTEVPIRGYYINGKWRSSIANINDKTWEETGVTKQTSTDILAMLKGLEVKDGLPLNAAIYNAAMLSVAVDNAKDLSLGKINAGPLTFGMYVYGLTLGMDIIELAKIMNSPLGKAIAKALLGNVFTGDLGAKSVATAIKYLNGETIGRYLTEYDFNLYKVDPDSKEETTVKFPINASGKYAKTASEVLYQTLLTEYEKDLKAHPLTKNNKARKRPRNFAELIAMASKEGLLLNMIAQIQLPGTYFSETMKTLAKLQNGKTAKNYPKLVEWQQSIYQLMDWLEEYAELTTQWNSNIFRTRDLKILAGGAEEMRRLGTFLGSNKGVRTKIEDGLNFVNAVEEAIIARKQDLGQEVTADDRIDFVLFCADPEYRELCIQKYEQVKHSINILLVVAATPHMLSYLRTSSIPYAAFMAASSKFRSILAMERTGAYERVGAVTQQEKASANRGLSNAVNAAMMMQWLSDTKKYFVLPPGQMYFLEGTGKRKVATENTPIALWTPEGLATFKMYMENELIPHLQRGKDTKANKFIANLTPFSFNQTGTRTTVQAYHLPEDMMAKEGSAEEARVKEYQAAFRELGNIKFPLRSLVKDGSTIGNLLDAFYIYSEYVFGGRKGPSSLMSMFDAGDCELLREFREAKAAMDALRDFILTPEQQIKAMALVSTTASAKYPYYYGTASEDLGMGLYKNEEKLLSPSEKQDILDSDPNARISKAVPFSMKSEVGQGEVQSLFFLYPQLGVQSEVRNLGEINVVYDGKKFISWEATPDFTKYYFDSNMSEDEQNAQMKKDIDAIEDAIQTINDNMGVISSAVYNEGKISMEVKNLDILKSAIEMSLKHSRGEC